MSVYLDNNATTQTAPEVIEAMLPYFAELYQNPSSISGESVGIRRVLGRARREIAELLDIPDPASLAFTSGATESNNWALVGIAEAADRPGHIVTSAIEHPSVLEPVRRLEARGWRVTILQVGAVGLISPEDLSRELRGDTVLVSIMTANNETGAIQSISTLSRLVKEMVPAALFHTDATQAVGKISISVDRDYSDVDLLSLSAHKFHGPKGIGALFIREGTKIAPLILGGGQENGRRSGTTNVPGAVGIGVASTLAAQALRQGSTVSDIRDRMETRLRNSFSDIVVHASQAPRLPNTSCFSLPGCSANSMADLLATKGFYVGTGSACSSGALEPPRTLIAMGVDYETARSALRVSLSRYSREEESESLVEALATARGSFLHSV